MVSYLTGAYKLPMTGERRQKEETEKQTDYDYDSDSQGKGYYCSR
jgi:hypothetical protein